MKKKLFIRIWIVITVIAVASFSDWSFAADDGALKSISEIMNFLTQVLARIWVIFAKFAWEFLTNKRVYWEILWLDALLWKYWVVVRNIANFWLWLFFTYTVFIALFKKEDAVKNLKNVLWRLLVAWIWIQTSRFLTAVVMDVSTITLVSVWSFPSQVMSENDEMEKNFRSTLRDYLDWNTVITWKQLELFPKNGTSNGFLVEIPITIEKGHEVSKEEFLDDLLPKYDSVAWPLYYIWVAILDSFSISNIPKNTSSDIWIKSTILNTIINGWTTIVYSIEMMILCIVALLRIFYLWMFITLSPIVVLFYCIKKADSKGLWSFIEKNMKDFTANLNIKSFLINAFKPTIIVLWISLSVVFVSTMKWVLIQDDTVKFQWVNLSSHCSQLNPSIKCETRVNSELFEWVFANLGKTLMNIILSILTVILIYEIIKIAVGIGGWDDFISKKVKWLQDDIWKLITATPIIPVKWTDINGLPRTSYLSMGTALWIWNNRSLLGEKIKRVSWKIEEFSSAQTESVMAGWLWKGKFLTDSDKNKIRQAWEGLHWIATLNAKKQIINNINKNKNDGKGGVWMKLNPNTADPFWREEFTAWLDETPRNSITITSQQDQNWQDILKSRQGQKEEDRDLVKLFNNQRYATTYANYFGYGWTYTDFGSIKDLDVSESLSSTP